ALATTRSRIRARLWESLGSTSTRCGARWTPASILPFLSDLDRPVATAIERVHNHPRQERQPVGSEPVSQGCHDRLLPAHVGEDQQARQAGLNDTEASRSD